MNIEPNAEVTTSDGHEVGRVHRVVVDLEQRAVVSIVVLRGRLLPRDVLVPLDFVDQAHGNTVTLRLTADELGHLPSFAYNRFYTAPPTFALPLVYPGGVVYIPISQRQRMSATQEDLTPGMRVRATDGELGEIERVEFEETGHLDAFWVRTAAAAPDLRIPVEWVERIDDTGVYLSETQAEVEAHLSHDSQMCAEP